MADVRPIVKSKIPQVGINLLRSHELGTRIEQIITPEIGDVFSVWLKDVAYKVAADWPRRTGRSATQLANSSRVIHRNTLDSIQGYFLVSVPILANEYGTKEIRPHTARMLAIPILDGVYSDGRPKRLGPNSWRAMGSFIYKSKRSGLLYIAYKTGDKLRILYLLVDKTKGLKELRKIRNTYDVMLPQLYAVISAILQDALYKVYSNMFLDALNSIDSSLKMQRPPRVTPLPIQPEQFVPKY